MERYPWPELILLLVLRIIVFFPTRRHTYRVVVLAASIYLAIKVSLTPSIANPMSTAYVVGQHIGIHFGFVTYLLFAEGTFPDHWRRVRDEVRVDSDASDSSNLPSNFSLMKKVCWMLDLAHSHRMVGWVQEPKDCLPPHPPPSRKTFLWKTLLKYAAHFVIFDLTNTILAQNPVSSLRTHDPSNGPETYLASLPLPRRVPYVLAFGVLIAMVSNLTFQALGLLLVGLGLSNPTLWPGNWGRWRDGFTIRKLWGRTWHQALRPTVSGLGRLVANKLLKFPRGTNLSSYTQLYVAFFFSALFHLVGESMAERQMVYRSLKFFLLQAVGITFEDFIIYTAKRLLLMRGIKLEPGRAGESWVEVVVRLVGYCWVILWFCLTLPIYVDGAGVSMFNSAEKGPITQFLSGVWERWS